MQLMIDLTATNDAATLRRVAALLIEVANASSVPEGTVAAPVVSIPPPPVAIVPPPPPPAPDTTATTASVASTAPSVPSAPPAPPYVPAPQPTSVPAKYASDVQLDKAGFPWDARIHSETPTINKSDGLWRMKRGIGDKRDVVEAVEAELRANYPAPVNAAPIIPPPPVSLPAAAPVIPPPPAVVAAPNAPAATVMVPPPPPVAGSVPSGTDEGAAFRTLMNKVAGHTGPEGRLRREIMVPIYESLGCKSLTDFHKARDKIPALLEAIEALLA